MKYTIIIPAIESTLLNRCLSSMDNNIRENVIVYKNAPDITVEYPVLNIAGTGVNDGLSVAWNVARNHVIDNEQDYLLVLSQNVQFQDGMRDFISQLDTEQPKYGVWSSLSWHLVALSRETLEKTGEFDTNCYPAYYEDNEYAIRMHKLGILDHIYNMNVNASCEAGVSTRLGIRVNIEAIKQYVVRKWGQPIDWVHYHEQEFFDHPYNDPKNDITYFEKRTTAELMTLYGYDNNKNELYVRAKQ